MWNINSTSRGGVAETVPDGRLAGTGGAARRDGRGQAPRDLRAYGNAVAGLLDDPALGCDGRTSALAGAGSYLGTRSLLQYIALSECVLLGDGLPAEASVASGYG